MTIKEDATKRVPPLAGLQPESLKEYGRIGESAGLAPEMCAADKGILGMLLSGGAMPLPDFFVPTTLPCDNLFIGYQIFQNILNVLSFVVEAPYGDGEEESCNKHWVSESRVKKFTGANRGARK